MYERGTEARMGGHHNSNTRRREIGEEHRTNIWARGHPQGPCEPRTGGKDRPGHPILIPLVPTSLSELCFFAQAASTRQMIPLEISRINHPLKVSLSIYWMYRDSSLFRPEIYFPDVQSYMTWASSFFFPTIFWTLSANWEKRLQWHCWTLKASSTPVPQQSPAILPTTAL